VKVWEPLQLDYLSPIQIDGRSSLHGESNHNTTNKHANMTSTTYIQTPSPPKNTLRALYVTAAGVLSAEIFSTSCKNKLRHNSA
jgi:hypothetical protein